MKRLDVVSALEAELSEESRLATLLIMVENQIAALETLLESNAGCVKDAGAWNVLAGYMDQFRYWAPRVFYSADSNVIWAEVQEGTPAHPLLGRD